MRVGLSYEEVWVKYRRRWVLGMGVIVFFVLVVVEVDCCLLIFAYKMKF